MVICWYNHKKYLLFGRFSTNKSITKLPSVVSINTDILITWYFPQPIGYKTIIKKEHACLKIEV